MTGEEERARVLWSAIPNRTDSRKLSLPLFPPVFSLTQMYVSASFYTLKGGDPCRSSWEKARKHPPPSKMVGFPTSHQADPMYPSTRKKEKRTDAL